MRIFGSITTALLTVFIVIPHTANAQVSGSAFSGINTSSGLFGSRTLGQSVGGRGSNFGPSGSGLNTPGTNIQQTQADAGQVSGGERFLRDNRQPGAFVGADVGDASNFFSQMQGGFTGNGLEALLGRRQDFQNSNQGRGSSTPLRPRLTLGFNSPGPSDARISTQLSSRLTKLPNLELLSPVTVSMIGDTAVLQGRVATEHARVMIAQVALLEPGVGSVQNDLQVGDQTAAPQVQPAIPPIPDPVGPPAPSAPMFDD